MEESVNAKPGLLFITLIWGFITQFLQWGGVIDWPWFVIWGPCLVVLGIIVLILLFMGFAFLLALIAAK